MQSELRRAQQDNWELRGQGGGSGTGACGGAGASNTSNPIDQQIQMQRFAQELKAAASTAETSLRYGI